MKQYIDSRTGNTFSIIVAILIVGAGLAFQNYRSEERREARFAAIRAERAEREATPATEFFTVREVNIPDHPEGTDPVMVYDRTIKKDFLGTFIVEIHKAEKDVNYAVCSNSATRTYKAGEKPPETVTLDWFVDRKCGLTPGQYVAETNWKIEAEGYPPKNYSAVSNVFRVLPKGAQLYIDPAQVQQLEKAQELLDNPKVQEQLGLPTVP